MYWLKNYTNRNTNARALSTGHGLIYFSYETVIAFTANDELHVSPNLWGTTTGRHINAAITDARYVSCGTVNRHETRESFEEAFEEAFK